MDAVASKSSTCMCSLNRKKTIMQLELERRFITTRAPRSTISEHVHPFDHRMMTWKFCDDRQTDIQTDITENNTTLAASTEKWTCTCQISAGKELTVVGRQHSEIKRPELGLDWPVPVNRRSDIDNDVEINHEHELRLHHCIIMSPLRWHIRLLHGKIGFLGFFSAVAP